MPATRLLIFEKKRTLERRLRAACRDLPVDLRPVRSSEELRAEAGQSLFPIVWIEAPEELSESIDAIEMAVDAEGSAIMYLPRPVPAIGRITLRMAGASALIASIPEPPALAVLVRRLVHSSQEKIALAGGSRDA